MNACEHARSSFLSAPSSRARSTGWAGSHTAREYSNVIDCERLRQTAIEAWPAPTTAYDLVAESSHREGHILNYFLSAQSKRILSAPPRRNRLF
jgi:hypothetical protein